VRSNRQQSGVVSLRGVEQRAAAPVPAQGALETATEKRLSGCSRLFTPEGVLVLELARRIDAGGHAGSALASLANAYAKALDAATKDAGQDADIIDRIFDSA
jgi:hypothetical protein